MASRRSSKTFAGTIGRSGLTDPATVEVAAMTPRLAFALTDPLTVDVALICVGRTRRSGATPRPSSRWPMFAGTALTSLRIGHLRSRLRLSGRLASGTTAP